jgi:hypothetical protein
LDSFLIFNASAEWEDEIAKGKIPDFGGIWFTKAMAHRASAREERPAGPKGRGARLTRCRVNLTSIEIT